VKETSSDPKAAYGRWSKYSTTRGFDKVERKWKVVESEKVGMWMTRDGKPFC